MSTITLDDLVTKVQSGNLSEAELAQFFVVDEQASGPFNPRFKLNPNTVDISDSAEVKARTAQLFNAVNWIARVNRKHKYYNRIRSGYTGLRIVSEGDSWFQYPIFLKDTIDHISDHYAVYSLGAAGDLLERMAERGEYLKALDETGASVLLFSGGGNDLVAGGALASHLESYDKQLQPADYLLPSFHALLTRAFGHYERILRQVNGAFPDVQVLCHGYDYAIPDNGRWFGKPMQERGIRSRELQRDIANEMVDIFNRGLRRLCMTLPNATWIDCRGVVRDRWQDELHPDNDGFKDVASLFRREIRRIENARPRTRTHAISGPFGSAARLSRDMALLPDPDKAGNGIDDTPEASTNALSLHVGLNALDPQHYAGWDGRLEGCENDALDMAEIAQAQGFDTTVLLTADATRDAVVAEIDRAASALNSGDMFLFSIAGHGGVLPDFNRDEDDPGDTPLDESLCLYDFQIIDDELYTHWSKFKPGVRILMVADTCHSGNMVRGFSEQFAARLHDVDAVSRVRRMPFRIARSVWELNLDDYKARASTYDRVSDAIVSNPLKASISASVLLLAACKETELAIDGDHNGVFTAALKRTWNNGRFAGDYSSFIEAIKGEVNEKSQTPQIDKSLLRDPGFLAQIPFTFRQNPNSIGHIGLETPLRTSGLAPIDRFTAKIQSSDGDEGAEHDIPDEDEIERAFDAIGPANRSGSHKRSRLIEAAKTAKNEWADYTDFSLYITSLGLDHFDPIEFLVQGSGNDDGSKCSDLNTYPPRELWANIAQTARVLDNFRHRLGKPVLITNAYRSEGYNSCVGGVEHSQHKRFNAVDFKVRGMEADAVARELRIVRDLENAFKGGIGRYRSFTHLDTRGVNATWPADFHDELLLDTDITAAARRKFVMETTLAAESKRRGVYSRRAITDINLREHNAAVSASSVMGFTERMTTTNKDDLISSTLFAQLAADAAHNPIRERQAWFDHYTSTLGMLGWVRFSSPFVISDQLSSKATLDSRILNTLAAVATGNQLAVLKEALAALRALADDNHTISLFDKNATKTGGSNFQIGIADASATSISLALGAYNLEHESTAKNVLFARWGSKKVDIWITSQSMTLETTIYDDIRDTVKDRLGTSRKELIAGITLAKA